MTPEAKARQAIDALLEQAGWHVCDMADANIHAARGVALREFPLNPGYGSADYLLYVDGRAAGVIEAKKAGSTLTGVGVQSARYAKGLPELVEDGLWPAQVTAIRNLEASLAANKPCALIQMATGNRAHNLLRQLADSGRIRNVGGRRWPKWVQGKQLAGEERSKGNT